MFHWNPCVYDFGPGSLLDTSGAVDLAASNISWPRGGTWDHTTKTMTFNDDPGIATKDTYPFDSVTLPINQPFDCSEDGGWFAGSGHSTGNWGTQGGDRKVDASMNNPGRKRRANKRQRRAAFDTAAIEADNTKNKVKKLPVGGGSKKYNPLNETDMLEALSFFVEYMDTNHPNYFDDTVRTDAELAWMKWGAWNYLVGNTDGGSAKQRTQDGHAGLFIGISDIISKFDVKLVKLI